MFYKLIKGYLIGPDVNLTDAILKGINLTDMGKQVADTIRRKHSTLLEFLEILNVGKEIANQDTEGLEHHLNPKTIRQLRKFITFLKSNPKIRKQFHEF